MGRYADLTDDQKLKISNDLGKLMKTKKKVTYKTLSTLDKHKYVQGLNITKLAEGQGGSILAQYESIEKLIRIEEDRIEKDIEVKRPRLIDSVLELLIDNSIDESLDVLQRANDPVLYDILLEGCSLDSNFMPIIPNNWYDEFKIVKREEEHKTYEILNRLILTAPKEYNLHHSFSDDNLLEWYQNCFGDHCMNTTEDDYWKIIEKWTPRSFYRNAKFVKYIIDTELDDEKRFFIDDFLELIPKEAFEDREYLLQLREISSFWDEIFDIVCDKLGLDIEYEQMIDAASWTPGSIVIGRIEGIEGNGALVELVTRNNISVRGFIEIDDLSWGRIKHPREIVRKGQKVKCVVLDLSRSGESEITLGLKQLHNPWDEFPKRLEVGKTVLGKVVEIDNDEVFMEVDSGIEGILSVSNFPTPDLNVGNEYEVIISEIDIDKRIIKLNVLGLKR
jgi:predicted RNA-binding protein with RPS1 domain